MRTPSLEPDIGSNHAEKDLLVWLVADETRGHRRLHRRSSSGGGGGGGGGNEQETPHLHVQLCSSKSAIFFILSAPCTRPPNAVLWRAKRARRRRLFSRRSSFRHTPIAPEGRSQQGPSQRLAVVEDRGRQNCFIILLHRNVL